MNPHQVTRDFEADLARYAGAPYAVVVTSCTMALLLACAYYRHVAGKKTVRCPSRTYVGVPMSVLHAGHDLVFDDFDWKGAYRLDPLPVIDSARRLHANCYVPGTLYCLSFQATKILALEQGGAILTDDIEAWGWLRKARFDGRSEGVDAAIDDISILGYHAYVSPSVSAMGLMKLSVLPRVNDDLPNSNYPYLPDLPVFKDVKKIANHAIAAE